MNIKSFLTIAFRPGFVLRVIKISLTFTDMQQLQLTPKAVTKLL